MSDIDRDREAEEAADPLAREAPPPDLRLLGEPPRVMRLSRNALAIMGTVAGVGIGGALIFALQPLSKRVAEELYKYRQPDPVRGDHQRAQFRYYEPMLMRSAQSALRVMASSTKSVRKKLWEEARGIPGLTRQIFRDVISEEWPGKSGPRPGIRAKKPEKNGANSA